MKLMTFTRFPYTADLYSANLVLDAGGNEQTVFEFYSSVEIGFAADPNAPRMVFTARSPMAVGWQLRSVKDKNGNEVLPGAWYSITSVEPVISVLGTREHFQMKAALANTPVFEVE